MTISGWLGVDLDGTLAKYGGAWGNGEIGEPIPLMVEKVKEKLEEGVKVKIFTARVCVAPHLHSEESNASATQEFADEQRAKIEKWCERHLGQKLEVTAQKDFLCIEIWDDRAVRVIMNTGRFAYEVPSDTIMGV